MSTITITIQIDVPEGATVSTKSQASNTPVAEATPVVEPTKPVESEALQSKKETPVLEMKKEPKKVKEAEPKKAKETKTATFSVNEFLSYLNGLTSFDPETALEFHAKYDLPNLYYAIEQDEGRPAGAIEALRMKCLQTVINAVKKEKGFDGLTQQITVAMNLANPQEQLREPKNYTQFLCALVSCAIEGTPKLSTDDNGNPVID